MLEAIANPVFRGFLCYLLIMVPVMGLMIVTKDQLSTDKKDNE